MIARAACVTLAILAGSLASTPAAAQTTPSVEPPPGALILPALPPGQAPPPMIFRDGQWHPFGGFVVLEEPEPLPPSGRDPLFPAGITLGTAGLLTAAIGVGVLVNGGSSSKACGLSGCIGLPDPETQSYGAALIAGGAGAAIFGGAIAYAGSKGPASLRVSNPRMIAGLVFTTIGLATGLSGLVNAASPYTEHQTIRGEVIPPNYFPPTSSSSSGVTLAFALTSVASLGLGLPLWITGARAPSRHRRARDAASRLDLLPSAGGAAIRWTR